MVLDTAVDDLIYEVLRCRRVSSDAARVFMVLALNNPEKITRIRSLRVLSGIPKPGRCLKELARCCLIRCVRSGWRGKYLEIRRLSVADFLTWQMQAGEVAEKMAPALQKIS